MSDSDDSDDSGLPFDVEIEKCEKRLQLARYKKKYRNEWDYITNRWQEKHIHIVLKDIEQKWRVYSAGSHGHRAIQCFGGAESPYNRKDAKKSEKTGIPWISFFTPGGTM